MKKMIVAELAYVLDPALRGMRYLPRICFVMD